LINRKTEILSQSSTREQKLSELRTAIPPRSSWWSGPVKTDPDLYAALQPTLISVIPLKADRQLEMILQQW